MVDLPDVDRFWLPDGAPLPLIDRGFMPDPTDPSAGRWVPEARPFDRIAEHRSLMLIGEPGLGKTTAVKREATRLEAAGELVRCVDLSSTQDEALLRSKIFDGDVWRDWESGDRTLHLILDSLDFALIRLDTVVDVVQDGLERLDPDRLAIRLACRTAERQADLESWLRRRWGDDKFGVFEIAPLRLRDVDAAAKVLADPDAFIEAVVDRGLQPLAMTPMTLRMLVELALAEGELPASRRELYKRGCLRLCDEVDERRRRARRSAGEPTVAERFAVAQRLGGLLILAAEPGVTVDDATVVAMAGGAEINDQLGVASEFEVDEETVRDVLGTGLFTNVGDGRLHFAHQTYGEFLSGRWLAKTFTASQLDDLLFAATDEGLRVIPQLRETASWVAAHSPQFGEMLVARDPAALLRADPFTTLADERALMVEALLRAVGNFELDRFALPVRHALEHLAHPGLADQLRVTLRDDAASFGACEIAADIAVACALTELEQDLLALAHNDHALIRVREAAATALGKIGSVEARRGLVDLVVDPPATDVDDELKGAALGAVWPEIIALRDVLAALTTPKRLNLYGQYKHFLRVEFIEGLTAHDLGEALRAAAGWPNSHGNPLNGLADARAQVMLKALEHLDRDDVATAYAELIVGDLDQFAAVAPEDADGDPFEDPTRRHRLALELTPLAIERTLDGSALVVCQPALIRRDDISWLVGRLSDAVGTPTEVFWAQAAEALLFDNGVIDEKIFEAREISPILRETTAYAVEGVVLGSPQAEQLQERHRKIESIQRRRHERRKPRFDVRQKTADAKSLWDEGDIDGYWAVMGWLVEIDPGHRAAFASDPRALPGWDQVDETIHEFLRENAQTYLRRADVEAEAWFDRRVIRHSAWAAYRAFRLLYETDHATFDALEPEVWERWAPIVVGWPRDGEQEALFNDLMVSQLVGRAPDAAAAWLDRALKRDRRSLERGVHAIRQFRHASSPEVDAVLLQWARNRRLPPDDRAAIIDQLVQQGSEPALALAHRLTGPAAVRAGGNRLLLAAEVAAVLAERRSAPEWPRIWPLFGLDEEFGRQLVTSLASKREFALAPNLTERQVEELFCWLEDAYPHREDPDDDEVHWVSPREDIGRWRDGLLQNLVNRGTAAAVAVFDRLYNRFPQLVWVKAMRVRAAETARRAEWVPPDAGSVLAMAQDNTRRWITSDAALQSAVLEALDAFSHRLGGRHPQAGTLWDTAVMRPKSETEIGNLIAAFLTDTLRSRGIFLAEEAQVRPSKTGKGRGESVDIWIEAIIGPHAASPERATVVIELKGCWHRALKTAIKQQLIDRYLDPPLHRHGIYLIACFGVEQWDANGDKTRHAAAARHTAADLRATYERQARDLSAAEAVFVNAVVLDCSLPRPRAAADSRPSR